VRWGTRLQNSPVKAQNTNKVEQAKRKYAAIEQAAFEAGWTSL